VANRKRVYTEQRGQRAQRNMWQVSCSRRTEQDIGQQGTQLRTVQDLLFGAHHTGPIFIIFDDPFPINGCFLQKTSPYVSNKHQIIAI
jgi:hypothetical protein